MTSFRLSELPTPCVTAGFPAGCTLGEAQPTGKVYFSGTSTSVQQDGGLYIYTFDTAGGSDAEDLIAKQVGDEMLVTIDGTTQTLEVTMNDVGEEATEFTIGWLAEEIPLVFIGIVAGEYAMVAYYSYDEASAPVTMTIADPS